MYGYSSNVAYYCHSHPTLSWTDTDFPLSDDGGWVGKFSFMDANDDGKLKIKNPTIKDDYGIWSKW